MKRFLLATLLSVLFQFSSFSQNEWAPVGAKWYFSLPDNYGNPFTDVLIYHTRDDTTIENKKYKVVQSEIETYLFTQSNDSIKYLYDNHEYLAYYFGCNESDTISLDFFTRLQSPNNPDEFIDSIISVEIYVDSIDTIYNGSIPLKEIHGLIIEEEKFPELIWPGRFSYTEKIGSQVDMIPKLEMPSFPENSLIFRCYIDSQISYTSDFWGNHSKPCDYIETSNRSPLASNDNFLIYPNPVSTYLTVEKRGEYKGQSLLEIFSLSGQLILRKFFSKELLSMDVSEFSRGVYLVKLKSENQITYYKIIKL